MKPKHPAKPDLLNEATQRLMAGPLREAFITNVFLLGMAAKRVYPTNPVKIKEAYRRAFLSKFHLCSCPQGYREESEKCFFCFEQTRVMLLDRLKGEPILAEGM